VKSRDELPTFARQLVEHLKDQKSDAAGRRSDI
jgi:hypothetical protein